MLTGKKLSDDEEVITYSETYVDVNCSTKMVSQNWKIVIGSTSHSKEIVINSKINFPQ